MFKWEMVEDGQPMAVFLCLVHIMEIKECMATIASVREQEKALEQQEEIPPEIGRLGGPAL